MDNPYDVLKVLLGPPYGPAKVPCGPLFLLKKEQSSSLKKAIFLPKNKPGLIFREEDGLFLERKKALF